MMPKKGMDCNSLNDFAVFPSQVKFGNKSVYVGKGQTLSFIPGITGRVQT